MRNSLLMRLHLEGENSFGINESILHKIQGNKSISRVRVHARECAREVC